MYYDDHGLVGKLIEVMWLFFLVYYMKYNDIYLHVNYWERIYWCIIGDNVDYEYVLICVVLDVETWLFLLDYMSCDGYINDDTIINRST